MTNKPSRGALDFARRHNLPEPKTKEEALEMMRKKTGLPRYGEADTRSQLCHYPAKAHKMCLGGCEKRCRRKPLWDEADEARMDIIGSNGGDGAHYTGSTTNAEKVGYDSGDENSKEQNDE